MYLRSLAVVFVLIFSVMGCDFAKYVTSSGKDNTNSSPLPFAVPTSTSAPLKPESTPQTAEFIGLLANSAGKYPADIKLLENAEIRNRLKSLLGKDFAILKSNWNVEMPIEISGNVFKAEACEAHNCGSNRYIIFFDLKGDNFNVLHVQDEVPKSYLEHGEIKLPSKFSDQIVAGQ
ncbi:MAG: hypothetical protein ABJA02_04360 [Acidobacteriota bacterium]